MENVNCELSEDHTTLIGNDDDNNHDSNNIGNIIIRVKRRRDVEPIDRLCIVEENLLPERKKIKDLIENFSSLNQFDNNNDDSFGNKQQQQQQQMGLVLSRIETFQEIHDVDSQTIITATTAKYNNKRERNNTIPENVTNNKKLIDIKNHLWVTQGKKCLRLNEKGSFVIVDLSQEKLNNSNENDHDKYENYNYHETKQRNIEYPKGKIPILDPPTRRLDLAIENARKSGDFTDMNNAILLGANINYQRYQNKQTCLMIATMHANVRMVAKLLMKDADIFAEDIEGKVAYDYVEKNCISSKRGATLEVKTMLQNSKMKAFQLGIHPKKINKTNKDSIVDAIEEDYVVDIFMLNANVNDDQISTEENDEDSKFVGPTIAIEGLHILDDGRGELLHFYDSDWSDLADDEDIDSNDERYEGNDYPEEEDNSDNNNVDKRAHFMRRDNSDQYGIYDEEDYDDDDDHDDGYETNRYQRNRIGRVMHHSIPDDPFINLNRDQTALRELWGEDNDLNADEEFNEDEIDYEDTGLGALKDHRERIIAMREKSGLRFASNPREFNSNGLPKYGQDLSDDEIDEKLLRDAYEDTEKYYQNRNKINRFISTMPPKSSIAFDPEMDLSDSDD